MSAFGVDLSKFDIKEEQKGKSIILVATANDEYREKAGTLVITGNVITKLTVHPKHKPTYELLKYACGKFDQMNQPLMVDQNSMSLNAQRTLEDFGFRAGDDSILMRRPYAVIPVDFAQPNIPKKG